MHSDSTLSTFIAYDGDHLVVQDWPAADNVPLRGVILIVHGLGEHAGRYGALARQLNAWGFAVRGYDQCGHGESAGLPGSLPAYNRLLDDLSDMIDSSRSRVPPTTPLIVLGHNLGGVVAGRFVSLSRGRIEGLILSSPALQPRLTLMQKVLLATVPRLLPNLRVRSGVKSQYLSHNPAVAQAYDTDWRVHDRVSMRLTRFIATEGPATGTAAARWQVPTLLLYAGDDHIVHAQGSHDFAAEAPRKVVTAVCFNTLYHELFNEQDNAPVYAALKQWLDQRF